MHIDLPFIVFLSNITFSPLENAVQNLLTETKDATAYHVLISSKLYTYRYVCTTKEERGKEREKRMCVSGWVFGIETIPC